MNTRTDTLADPPALRNVFESSRCICVKPGLKTGTEASTIESSTVDQVKEKGPPEAASPMHIQTLHRLRAERFARYSLLLLVAGAGIAFFSMVIAALFLTLLDIYGKEFNKQLDLVHNGA